MPIQDDSRTQSFLADLNSESLLQLVVRGHLWIEGELIALIEQSLPFPSMIDLARLTFPTKLDLAAAHGHVREEDIPAYRKLNALRNKIAHNLHQEFQEADERALTNCLSQHQAKLAKLPDGADENWVNRMRTTIAVLYVVLEGEVKNRH